MAYQLSDLIRHSVYLGISFPICKMGLTQYGHIMGLLQILNKIYPKVLRTVLGML